MQKIVNKDCQFELVSKWYHSFTYVLQSKSETNKLDLG